MDTETCKLMNKLIILDKSEDFFSGKYNRHLKFMFPI